MFRKIQPHDHETKNILFNILEQLTVLAADDKQTVTFNEEDMTITVDWEEDGAAEVTTVTILGSTDSKTTAGALFTVFLGVKDGKLFTFSESTALYGAIMY